MSSFESYLERFKKPFDPEFVPMKKVDVNFGIRHCLVDLGFSESTARCLDAWLPNCIEIAHVAIACKNNSDLIKDITKRLDTRTENQKTIDEIVKMVTEIATDAHEDVSKHPTMVMFKRYRDICNDNGIKRYNPIDLRYG